MAQRGRKRIKRNETTARIVRSLSTYGITVEDIAHEIGMDQKTMRNLYGDELKSGRIKANIVLAQRIWNKAIKEGDRTTLIFLAKVRLGYSTVTRIDHTSSDGTMTPSASPSPFDLSLLSPEQIAALRGASANDEDGTATDQ